jgi:hypothetical protein
MLASEGRSLPRVRGRAWVGCLLLAGLVAGSARADEPRYQPMLQDDDRPAPPPVAEAARPKPQPQADASTGRLDTGVRVRFGIAIIFGVSLDGEVAGPYEKRAILGLDLRLGLQIDDLFAVMSQVTTGFFDVGASALFEVTPNRWLSLAVGVGAEDLPDPPSFRSPPLSSSTEINAVIVPIRLALNVPLGPYEAKQRSAISFAVYLTPGFVYFGQPVETGQRFDFAVFGGLGYEVY